MMNILVYEPDKNNAPHIKFLLKVADIRCTLADSTDELLNWLATDSLKTTRFDLLLLNSWPNLTGRKDLFDEVTTASALPIIFVLRGGQYRPPITDRRIAICHPENMLKCIKLQLTKGTTETDDKQTLLSLSI